VKRAEIHAWHSFDLAIKRCGFGLGRLHCRTHIYLQAPLLNTRVLLSFPIPPTVDPAPPLRRFLPRLVLLECPGLLGLAFLLVVVFQNPFDCRLLPRKREWPASVQWRSLNRRGGGREMAPGERSRALVDSSKADFG